jgi:hypothetical protein
MPRLVATIVGSSRRRSAAASAVALLGGLLAVVLVTGDSATGSQALAAKRQRCVHVGHSHHGALYKEKVRCPSARGKRGPTGPQGLTGPTGIGPPGPTGAPGARGAVSANEVFIPRTTIPFTTDGSGAPLFETDGGNIQNLATVGPIHIDGLCRHTFSPGSGGGENFKGKHGNQSVSGKTGAPTHPAPFLPTRGGESEAQVIVWIDASGGSMTFRGAHGKRHNVPPGPPDYTTETFTPSGTTGVNPSSTQDRANVGGVPTAQSNPVAGEGDHLFLAASNEDVNEARATDPASDNPLDPTVKRLGEYPAFNSGVGFIGTSDGHFAEASVLAGFDVLGAYGECVFAGVVHPYS